MKNSYIADIKHTVLKGLLLTGMVITLLVAMQTNSISAETSVSTTPAVGVKLSEVCMVNDRFMGKAQIPIEVEGKTYYGCCEGCKSRLKNDRSVRYSTDPLTGKEVDKALAYIVLGDQSEALYFKSEETATRYKNR